MYHAKGVAAEAFGRHPLDECDARRKAEDLLGFTEF